MIDYPLRILVSYAFRGYVHLASYAFSRWAPCGAECSKWLILLDPSSQTEAPTYSDVRVFDGPAEVHSLPLNDAKTFGEYTENFIRWTHHQLQGCKRIDVVWDLYKEESLKSATHEKRGKGVRRKVSSQKKNYQQNLLNFCSTLKTKQNCLI